MYVSRIAILGTVSIAACTGNPKPKMFGPAAELTPTVEIVGTTPLPLRLRIAPPQPEYVAVFFVTPGQRIQKLFPTDSTGSQLLAASSQEVATSFAAHPAPDTSRLLRRPGRAQPPIDASGNSQSGSSGTNRSGQFQESSFVLVYAAKDSLTYKTLNDRVIGVSVPGYADEALNAVTKLIRAASTGSGPWSAIALPFRP